MEAHQTSNLGVLSSSLSEDVFYFLPIIFLQTNAQYMKTGEKTLSEG